MRCPFLREEQVKSCRAVPFRKPLARTALKGADERCSSPDHVLCPAAPPSREAHPATSRCPFLLESLVQFCAAAPVPRYVPWSESPDLRCGHDGHRFCELFLAIAGAGGRRPPIRSSDERVVEVAGIPMPEWLYYAPNHFWLDVGDDGLTHLGLDAFLAGLVGSVDRLTFLTLKGTVRPAVVLTIHGVDLTLAFARPLPLVAVNTRLRSNPTRLSTDPYGLGWLFEARLERAREQAELFAGLLEGQAARAWMAEEVGRAARFVHEQVVPRSPLGTLLADGGGLAPGALGHLGRDQLLCLFAQLFPLPFETRRTS
jgi:glycine cleavage system H lipoate-binding protein